MKSAKLLAYAKINLTLDITGRRADGYHDVEMVMQSVGLCDTVEITLVPDGEIQVVCDDPFLPQGRENLAYKAAERFFAATGAEVTGVRIVISKRIPSQAGLAGGSADAAAVFCGLNALLETGLDRNMLAEFAVPVGADVPFCIRGGTMLARGLGEKLAALTPLPACTVVLVKPPEAVSTPAAYVAFDACVAVRRPDTKSMCNALASGSLAGVAEGLCNVFEQAVCPPSLAAIKAAMAADGALGTAMTGSGSAVYGLFADTVNAAASARKLRTQFNTVFVCTPVHTGCSLLSL